jgi:S-formylglutathione hydrolase FrmB
VNHANFVAQNPTSLAPKLRTTGLVYLSSGDGVPESGQELADSTPGFPIQMYAEATVSQMNRHYDAALTAAHVAHVYRTHPGIHATPHWIHDLADFWPRAMRAIGGKRATPRPRCPAHGRCERG